MTTNINLIDCTVYFPPPLCYVSAPCFSSIRNGWIWTDSLWHEAIIDVFCHNKPNTLIRRSDMIPSNPSNGSEQQHASRRSVTWISSVWVTLPVSRPRFRKTVQGSTRFKFRAHRRAHSACCHKKKRILGQTETWDVEGILRKTVKIRMWVCVCVLDL